MRTDLRFEEITESDIPELTEVMTRAFDDDAQKHLGQPKGGPPGYDDGGFFREWLFGYEQTVGYKAVSEGKIVGAIIVWILPGDHNVLGAIFVDPDFQDRGVGTRIWQFVEATYPQTKTWRLATPVWATKNHQFYEAKCGFQKVDSDPIMGAPEGEIVYWKEMAANATNRDLANAGTLPLCVRGYSGPEDLQAMIGLIARVRPPERLTDSPGIVDLQESFSMPDVQADTRHWFDGDELVAFAFVDPFNNLRFEAQPDVMRALETAAVSWGDECILRRPHSPGERITLDASCREDDAERIAMLQRNGFEMLPIRSLHLVRALSEPVPEPTLPPGFAIRAIAGLDEAGALAALHRATFGTEYMTTERRLAMMTTPEYDPSLDLVAVAPDGSLAAYCMCSISADENARTGRTDGYADPVATHPRFRRQGLARALLLHGMRLLQTRGMDFARLGTSSDNAAMRRTAESAGFRVECATCWFEKPVIGRTAE